MPSCVEELLVIWKHTDLKHLIWHPRKYIQVCVQNVSDVNFKLADMKLSEKQHTSLELRSLNIKKQQVKTGKTRLTVTVIKPRPLWTNVCPIPSCVQLLSSKHSVFCLWEVRWKDNLPSCLQCVFATDFSPVNQDVSVFKLFHHQFQLERVTVGPFKCPFPFSAKDYWSCNGGSCDAVRRCTVCELRSCLLLVNSTVAVVYFANWRCS